MAKVEFLYNGNTIDILCNENDKLEKIIRKFEIKTKKKS